MCADRNDGLLRRYRETGDLDSGAVWEAMRAEAAAKSAEEPILGSYFHATVLNHRSFGDALSFRLASKLDNPMLPTMLIRDVIAEAIVSDSDILASALVDVVATHGRDPACEDLSTPFLFFKGFHALQAHRVAHWLWHRGRHTLALFFQSQISVGLGVDIHPAAHIGRGILIDHATGIVIGETAVVEDDVSISARGDAGRLGQSHRRPAPEGAPRRAVGRRLQGDRQHRNRRGRQGGGRQRGACGRAPARHRRRRAGRRGGQDPGKRQPRLRHGPPPGLIMRCSPRSANARPATMTDAERLVVWRLVDGKPGHEKQSAGLVQGLESPSQRLEVHDFDMRFKALFWRQVRGHALGARARTPPDVPLAGVDTSAPGTARTCPCSIARLRSAAASAWR